MAVVNPLRKTLFLTVITDWLANRELNVGTNFVHARGEIVAAVSEEITQSGAEGQN